MSGARNAHRSAEYHLYYTVESEPIVHSASAGDLLVIAKTKQDRLLVIICPSDSSIAGQLLWLFGLGLDFGSSRAVAEEIDGARNRSLDTVTALILENIGIVLQETEPAGFEEMQRRFGDEFPTTEIFSEFARGVLNVPVNPVEEPDKTLVVWMDHEEALFRSLERSIVEKRIEGGFMENGAVDVDEFMKFSLSVQNRRKSRAGHALSHHIRKILDAHGLRYKREATTEKKERP